MVKCGDSFSLGDLEKDGEVGCREVGVNSINELFDQVMTARCVLRGKALKLVRKRKGCRKWRNYSSIACLG